VDRTVSLLLLFLGCTATASTTGNCPFRTLASAGVRAGILTAQGQISAVAQASIAADFNQALDVHLNFTTQVTFDS
jgi:hypothetical protein